MDTLEVPGSKPAAVTRALPVVARERTEISLEANVRSGATSA
jgi:hypothetical protein